MGANMGILPALENAPRDKKFRYQLLAERGIHSAITYYREEERGGLCWF